MRHSERGQALIEILVASGIVMVVLMVTITMLQNQTRETRGLAQKVNAIELQRALTQLMADSSVCQKMISTGGFTIDASVLGGAKLPVASIPSSSADGAKPLVEKGKQVSPTAPDLIVKDMYFDQITPSGVANQYSAFLNVSYDPAPLVRQLVPANVRFQLTTNAAGLVTGCITNGLSGGGTGADGAGGADGVLPTSPGGHCTVLMKPMVRGAPGVNTSGAWSFMPVQCPTAFPVAMSTNTIPAPYAPYWQSQFTTSGTGGYFTGGICGIMYLRDAPQGTPEALAMYGSQPIDKGQCQVACCNL